MIVKERTTPLVVLEIDAILNRIPLFHQKRPGLEEDRRNYMTGFRGEQQIDYHLSDLENQNYLIFRDLRLTHPNSPFQMDTLLVSPFFILIIESKNIKGTLTFEKDSTQMIREWEGNLKGFKNPIVQVARQKKKLISWLKKHKFPLIPVEDLVGIADRRTIIRTTNDNRQIFNKLTHADVLMDKIEKFETMYTRSLLSNRLLQKMKNLLIKEHTPAPPSILKFHGIDESEVQNGLQCTICKHFSLIRLNQNWFCPHCKSYCPQAHKRAILDYFLIINITISNKQCREFLMLDSPDLTKKLLIRMNLPTTGSNKTRLYHRPKDLLYT